MRRLDSAAVITETENCAEQLARFFPGTRPHRLSVQVTAVRPGSAALRESTLVEFSAPENAIFLSKLPLEFADHVRLEAEPIAEHAGCTTEATVVAVQYHEGRKAVAVRFKNGPCAWVTQQ